MVKKNTKEKFKKIIFSFWFWAIIAIVSYFIFASIPIQWTGEGLEEVEGTGGLKTFFAYFTQIAWMITFVIIFIKIIKWIQKTKIGNYWKISFTILGIVGIIVYVIFSVSGWGIFNQSSPEDYSFNKEDSAKEYLAEKGYEVLSLSYGSISMEMAVQRGFTTDTSCYAYRGSDYDIVLFEDMDICWSNYTQANLEMKSLGNRNTQLWDGLVGFVGYNDVSIYRFVILTPTETCTYLLTGKTYRDYLSVDIMKDYSEENIQMGRAKAQKVSEEFEKYKTCS